MKNTSHNRSLIAALWITIALPLGLETSWAAELTQTQTLVRVQDEEQEPHLSQIAAGIATQPTSETDGEVHCLALNIYFEARGESEMGQRAVGHVVMNRVAHPRYPSSVCDVVRQGGEKKLHRCQFSWWCDGRSDKPTNRKVWEASLRLARQIYSGTLKDITDGALWYHATYVTPYWSKVLLQGDKIGQHIFYLENRQAKNTL